MHAGTHNTARARLQGSKQKSQKIVFSENQLGFLKLYLWGEKQIIKQIIMQNQLDGDEIHSVDWVLTRSVHALKH